MTQVNAAVVFEAAYDLLKTEHGPGSAFDYKFGDGRPPSLNDVDASTLATPFVSVYQDPISDPFVEEGYAAGPGMEIIRVRITITALHPAQVRNAAVVLAGTLTDQNAGGSWAHAITAAGHAVINRRRRQYLPIDGESSLSAYGGVLVDLTAQVA